MIYGTRIKVRVTKFELGLYLKTYIWSFATTASPYLLPFVSRLVVIGLRPSSSPSLNLSNRSSDETFSAEIIQSALQEGSVMYWCLQNEVFNPKS